MSAENLRIVEEIQAALGTEDVVSALASEKVEARVQATLASLAEPDFKVTMVAPDSVGGGLLGGGFEDRGGGGFTRLWEEWSEPFAVLRIEVDEMIDAGEKIVSLVRQIGRTKRGGVEIEETAAAVWTIRDGKLSRVEFHLDRQAAMRAAGLDPG